MCNELYKTLYQETLKFLKERFGVNGDHGFWCSNVSPRINNLKGVYQHFLQGLLYTKSIEAAVGDIETLNNPFLSFDPKKIIIHYGDNPDALMQGIMDIKKDVDTDSRHYDYMKIFCKGALSGADLLSQMGSLHRFRAFVDGFYYNEMTMTVLPLLLQMETGLTFQGACSFLDNIGYPDFICPDQKVKALWQDIGIIESRDNYEALKILIMIAKANGATSFTVHMIFFMIAAEKLPEQDMKGQMRQAFADHIIPIINQY